ncbi:MAG: metalloregulator ArsR/SmtB family transcription factor [Chloroflexaceae bacterium]|nr:metalloregulator ArsR/SmtB family transcription factor [Chloroflexaceae bacterium]
MRYDPVTRTATRQAALQVLKLLADDTRWQLIDELRCSDRLVTELVARTGLAANLVSYHLGLLRQAGFVRVRRSEHDGRAQYYALNRHALRQGCQQLNAVLQVNMPPSPPPAALSPVVFLCTHNSARSQMAEGWLRHLSGGAVSVQSAGTAPRAVHPLAIQVMAELGIDISQQVAKHLQTLPDPLPGVVVTVCDNVRELCRPHLSAAVHLHWSVPAPSGLLVPGRDPVEVFRLVRDEVRDRVEGLLTLLAHTPATS